MEEAGSEEKPAEDGAQETEGGQGEEAANVEGEPAGDQTTEEQQETKGNDTSRAEIKDCAWFCTYHLILHHCAKSVFIKYRVPPVS